MIEPPLLKVREDHDLGEARVEIASASGTPDNSSLSHFSATMRPSAHVEHEPASPRHRPLASMAWSAAAMIQYERAARISTQARPTSGDGSAARSGASRR